MSKRKNNHSNQSNKNNQPDTKPVENTDAKTDVLEKTEDPQTEELSEYPQTEELADENESTGLTDILVDSTDKLIGGPSSDEKQQKKKNKIFENIGLKILALLCSFVIWFIVMNLEDGVITKTVYDIPVDILNGESIIANGNLYNVTEGETVDVIVKGPRSVVENLEASNFEAAADISHLSVTNTTTISVSLNNTVNGSKAKKVTITPINQYVSLSIEEEVEKSVPVRVITTGSAAEGYAIGSVIPTPNMITVSGPESVLSNIVEARAVVDVNGAFEDLERTVRVGCIDGYGAAVEKSNITLSSSEVTVTIPVCETKEVPITITTAGKVHEGYGIRSINFEPSSVIIAGEKEVLDSISSIDIKDVVVTDATSNIEKNLDIVEYLPADVFVADGSSSEIAVSVELSETSEQEKTLNSGDIRILGAPIDYKLNFEILEPQILKVKVQGFEEDISDIDIVSLNPRINVEGLKEGKYDIEVEFDTADYYTIKDTYKVRVEVSEVE